MSVVRADVRTLDRVGRALAALGAVVALCAVMLVPGIANATVLQKFDTVSISRKATRIVVGTVLSTTAETYAGGVRTAVRMSVTDRLKGGATGTTVFYVPGGQLADGSRIQVDGVAEFAPGDTACVFIDDKGWVVGGFQGKVAVSGDRVAATGQRLGLFKDGVKAALATSKSVALPQGLVDPLEADPTAKVDFVTSGPAIASISPDTIGAGIGGQITITGSGFGAKRGGVTFFYRADQPRIAATIITSWTDTQIVCEVPVATVNRYSASPGSGPVIVTTADGLSSDGHNLGISFGNGQTRWASSFATFPTTRVTYRVNPGGVARAKELVDAAARVWNAAGANFGFVDGGLTTADPGATKIDGHNDIGWSGGLGAGIIGQAWRSFDSKGNLLECHIEFSTAFSWGDGTNGTMDIESIGLHEIGHWLCLRDIYGDDQAKVMYGFSSPGWVKRTLSAGDLAGILWIYGSAPTTPVVTPEPVPQTPPPVPVPPVDDTTAPVTSANIAPQYVGAAAIAFDATDDNSGVAGTWYTLDGATAVEAHTLSVSAVGTHTIDYWSVDAAGNAEVPQEVTFEVAAMTPTALKLSTPWAPTTAHRRTAFTLFGYIRPRVAAGTTVRVKFYRYESGHWRLRKIVTTHAADYSSGSKYAVRTSVPSSGTWRVRTYTSTDGVGTYSSYRTLRCR